MDWSEFLAWYLVINLAYTTYTGFRLAKCPAPTGYTLAVAAFGLVLGVFGVFDGKGRY